ncbi:hypothetical protein HHL22_11760 [Hymenobacter sp. RP-2-7]|uniref:PorT family protein n=1 Tax=Hymenobacter polaris TaxID=2682546 RepID=A0A7Y0FMU4_9BACT|nr:hypothetical protein [Hymenobacter polaris]NML65881.1 hypothetical protein [Hymenobacter polaris]
MRPLLLLVPSLLALGCPRLSVAQAPPPAPGQPATSKLHPRVFVGLGASAGIYRSFNEFFKSGPSPELTLGVRLTPRVALEMSTSYARHAEVNEYVSEPTFYDQTTNTNIHAHVRTEVTRQIVGVPILLRLGLSPEQATRLHLDLLAGVTVAQISTRDNFAARNDAQVVFYSFGSNTQTLENYLDAGLSLRYAAGSHIELLLNGLGQLSVTRPNPYGGNLCGSVSASVRYSFGGSPRRP